MKRGVYAQWVYVCGREKRKGKKEKERRGIGLNKAVGFAQSSRKTKWAQSKRPGVRGIPGQILSQIICAAVKTCVDFCSVCAGAFKPLSVRSYEKSVFSIQSFTPEQHILPSLAQKLEID